MSSTTLKRIIHYSQWDLSQDTRMVQHNKMECAKLTYKNKLHFYTLRIKGPKKLNKKSPL